MNEEQKKAFTETGRQAAYLYNGAFEAFKNSKQAERIVFLYFAALMFGKNETLFMLLDAFGKEK